MWVEAVSFNSYGIHSTDAVMAVGSLVGVVVKSTCKKIWEFFKFKNITWLGFLLLDDFFDLVIFSYHLCKFLVLSVLDFEFSFLEWLNVSHLDQHSSTNGL